MPTSTYITTLATAIPLVQGLVSLVENLPGESQRLRAELQTTRDELNRLKGEQGQPAFPEKHTARTSDHSSERQRRTTTPHRSRRGPVEPTPGDRTETVRLAPEARPDGAVFTGYRAIRIRQLEISGGSIHFRCDRWYDPTTGTTYQAALPAGYEGGFSPETRAYAVHLAHRSGMSEAAILIRAFHQAELREQQDIRWLTMPRKNHADQLPAPVRKLLMAFREIVETVNGQVATHLNVEVNHAHTWSELYTRLAGKLTAHTLGIYLNRRLDVPDPLQIKRLAFPRAA